MILIGADRYQAGLLALDQLKPDILLLDDGYQHIRLYRDLNILLLDASRPFGNGWTLPLGLLREPRSALGRADLAIFTRYQKNERLPLLPIPSCQASHQLTSFHQLATGEILPLEQLRQGRVAAFAGIADPPAFFKSLQQIGIQPVTALELPDHEPYDAAELLKLDQLFDHINPDWLITTEKDGVKLQGRSRKWQLQLVTARLEVRLEDDSLLQQSLNKLLSSRSPLGHTYQSL
jgi:tetraacyldisaccharide 4'-kinase